MKQIITTYDEYIKQNNKPVWIYVSIYERKSNILKIDFFNDEVFKPNFTIRYNDEYNFYDFNIPNNYVIQVKNSFIINDIYYEINKNNVLERNFRTSIKNII